METKGGATRVSRESGTERNERSSNAIRRRDALKSFVAGFAAVPRLGGFTAGHQSETAASAGSGIRNQRDQSFDSAWRFYRGDATGSENPAFDDSRWQLLDLPHDWSVDALPPIPESDGAGSVWGNIVVPRRVGPFDWYLSEGKRDTGWFVGGTGWYRKRFAADAVNAGDQVEIRFGGVYMNSDVWLNGQHLGNHPYGYTSFAYDLTPHLHRIAENVLAVRVRNEGKNSRWYSGSGIYRHVWLHVSGEVRIPL